MRLNVLNNVEDVAARQLCAGCGTCAALEPDRIEMFDSVEHGRRPRYRGAAPADARDSDAMRACPGMVIERPAAPVTAIKSLLAGWGPVLEVWEGHASDHAVRFHGSSGGAATALALAALEDGETHGVLHIRARRDAPILNETVLSTTREELLAATGSRYAPASPCDGLDQVEHAPDPCVMIGKPCDIAGAERARTLRPELDRNLKATISIFCAGTPTTRATLKLLESLGIDDPTDVIDLRYRGNGWPGRLTVQVRTPNGIESRHLSYEDAWGALTNDKQWRCHVCADHTGEMADISVGDPWHRPIRDGDPGRSLILVRTERGRALLEQARRTGMLDVRPADPAVLPAAQPNLLRGRGAVWGRLLMCRLLRIPAPRYIGFPMFRHWVGQLSAVEKIRSTVGTVRRVARRGLRRAVAVRPWLPPRSNTSTSPEVRRCA